jgi:hypothetical protein
MLEAMRILREVYPQPRRTILLALWGGEEQGLEGSRRFVESNPEVVDGLQLLLNLDAGTGRISEVSADGLVGLAPHLARWFAALPDELSKQVILELPGMPGDDWGSDHFPFIARGAPAVNLMTVLWGYDPLTHHTSADTYDKLVFEELRPNAVLVAMLAYLAAEDPARVSRERRILPPMANGQPQRWPSNERPVTVLTAASVSAGHSLRDDGKGAYAEGLGTPAVHSRVGPDHLRLCTQAGMCNAAAYGSGAPVPAAARVTMLDLGRPVEGSGARSLGTVRAGLTLLQSYWADQVAHPTALALPLNVPVAADRTEIRFLLEGREHMLQFGRAVNGQLDGTGTTTGTITRLSDSEWVMRSDSSGLGRLWELGDDATPRNPGLYTFSYEVFFRVPRP